KFKEKGDEGYFIGYSMFSKAFRVFNKRTRRVEENLHVEFLENNAIEKGDSPNWLFDIDSLSKSMNYVPVDAEFSSSKPQDHCSTEVPKSSGNPNPTASTSNPLADQMKTLTVESPITTVSSPVPTACCADSPEPSSDARLILKRVANQVETQSLDNILTLTNRFEDILGVTTNTDESNGVEADVSNIETTITASPTLILRIHKDRPKSQITSPVDTLIQTRNKSKQMDVKSAFLYGTIDEEVYVMQPLGFQDPEFPARVGTIDQTLFIRRQRGDFILIQVYVDDIIFGSSNPQLCREFEALMHEKIQMSAMGELNFFLGLQVLQKEDGIFLSQDKYVGDILKKFRYSKVRSSNTPIDKENPCGKDETGKDVDLHLYRSMIGSLMYLTASRPDIMFAVCACARHQVTPKECHLHAVKRIFRCLKGHPKLGLWYLKISPFDLVAYSDSDYGGATQDRKSTTGGCQFLGRRLISWRCKKQTIMATSTTEAGYVAAASCCGQVLWIQNQLLDYGYALTFKPTVYVSHIRQFWSTARIETMEEGTKILAIVDGILRTGEGSATPTEPHHTPSPEAQPLSHTTHSSPTIPSVTTALIPPITSSDTPPIRQYTRRTRIAQSSVLPPVADEPASLLRDVSQGEACPTDSSFIVDQDRATIAKSFTLPYDSAPRVTSLAADEGNMQQTINELTTLCTSLQRQHSEMIAKFEAQEVEINRLKARVKLLEDREGVAAERSGDDAPIKGRNLDEWEAAAERVSDDTEEMAIILTSMDAATVLASSDVVPTASPVFATAIVVTPYRRKKGKEVMVEYETPKKQKVQEQIDA
nr:hypothetical protein [Tanacetum cinerariifolium]